MNNNEYHLGQRWVSNTEADLGIGFIEKIEGRHLTIIFPAVDETRVYAIDNAPLSRVKYPVGEVIQTEDGDSHTVTGHAEHNHCIVYQYIDENGNEVGLHELELDSFAQFSQPQDRLFAGQIDKNKHFKLRIETLDHLYHQQKSDSYGLLGPRIQPLPHQLYIAHQVAMRHAPRVLLADEVGLGKTIEAGLILHQQLLTERVTRCLIVVPETLVHQWLVEMLRRFNLHFTVLDEERCFAIEEEGDADERVNPFESAQLVLCSLSFLTENPTRHQQAVEAGWDIMTVDEAHHLSWSEAHISNEYVCIESLARKIPGLLLLTATPEQLGVEGHFARLRLLDPDRFFDLKSYAEEEANYKPVNELVQWLLEADSDLYDEKQLVKLEKYLGKEAVNSFEIEEDKASVVESVIQSLLDRHGTGRVLYRNTRDSVGGFPQRELHEYKLEIPELYQIANESSFGLEKDLENLDLQLHPELSADPSDWILEDPRVEWLVDWLENHPKEKVLLICAYAETALALEEYLRLRTSVNASVFHEGLSIIERDRSAAYFADNEMGAQILLCSEIGSEGRNFQFAHHLILFDLPLNPDLLEQRIGRLDRIGQTETIKLHVPYFAGTAQEKLLNWYHQGLNAFQHVCSVGHGIFEVFENEIKRELLDNSSSTFDDVIARTKVLVDETLTQMQQGRDRLLELNSCHKEHAQEVIDELEGLARENDLSEYMDEVFDQYGVDQQIHGNTSFILKPTDHMMNANFPSLPEDGLTATYHRETALSREDMHFITWEHPMVMGAMDMILTSEFGNATFCALELDSDAIDAGTLMLEAIFTVSCPAPKYLQLPRYLTDSTVRIVVDNTGRNLSDALSHASMNSHTVHVDKRTTQELIQHARPQIQTLVEIAENLSKPQQIKIIKQAQTLMMAEAKEDIERLRALAEVNPNIRKEEVTILEDNATALASYLEQARLKLDSIRVGLVTK
ncbi:MAG: RNA polymerase-associated protein RapA [Cocleimonas sp.]